MDNLCFSGLAPLDYVFIRELLKEKGFTSVPVEFSSFGYISLKEFRELYSDVLVVYQFLKDGGFDVEL